MKEINVVILDDENNILHSLERVLHREEFGVFTTVDYKEAMDVIGKENIKVVVSDHRMPGISGVDFLEKAKVKKPSALRILLTGFADIKVAEDAINKDQVYRFMNKPWNDEDLKATLRQAVHKFDLIEHNKHLVGEIKTRNEELMEVNKKLRSMYETQKKFTSTVSHELRTPLASIKTAIDIVKSETSGELNDDQKNFLNKAKDNIDRLNRLINDILDLSKLESGMTSLDLKKNNMNKIISDIVQLQESVAQERGIVLKAELDPDVPEMPFDADKINQVLNNLISNAFKFTEKGEVVVSSSAEKEHNYIKICVRDTGMGIEEKDIPKLFKKFQQLGDPAERKTGGTGLGLAICKEITSQHKGKIWVESKSGEGSAFYFLLPIKERRIDR